MQGGFAAALFEHCSARSDKGRTPDPQLHTHALLMNLSLGEDGRWGALDARHLFCQKMTAGVLYRTELFYLLQEESEGSPGLLQKILSSLLEEGLLYRDWVQKDPRTVLSLSNEISPNLEERMLGQWAGTNGPSALEWVKDQPKDSRFDSLAGKVIETTLYHQDSFSTFLALTHEMSSENQAQEHRQKILSRWRTQDPQGLQEHLNSGKATPQEIQTAREIQSSK